MKRYLKNVACMMAIMMLLSTGYTHTSAEENEVEQPPVAEYIQELTQTSIPVPTEEPTPVPTEVPTPVPTTEPTPVPTAVPTSVPTEVPTPVPTEEPTPVPTAVPTPVPTEVPTPAPTEEPTPVPTEEPTPAPTEEPTPVPMEIPSSSFEQIDLIGSTAITVTAPAGVMMPGSHLVVHGTSSEAFAQSVLAASQAKGDIIRHRMFSFSGAEINGTALVEIKEPLILELENQNPGAEIKIYVYSFQPDAIRLEDQARRISAAVTRNVVSFNMTDLTIYDVMIVVRLPMPEPTAAPIPASTPAPTPQPTLEETEMVEEESADAVIHESLAEILAEPDNDVDNDLEIEITIDILSESEMEDEATAAPESETEASDDFEAAVPAEPADESEPDVPTEPTVDPEQAATDEPADTSEPEPTADELPDEVTPQNDDGAEVEAESFTVTVSSSHEGDLHDGSTVMLTATLSIDVPNAVITWEYSPDGGETVFTVEGEHGNTLVYTYSEDNKDYSWRAVVRRMPAE